MKNITSDKIFDLNMGSQKVFIMTRKELDACKGMKDADGYYLYHPSFSDSEFESVNGCKVVVVDDDCNRPQNTIAVGLLVNNERVLYVDSNDQAVQIWAK